MFQSGFHDGKQPNWFHQACFFKKQRPTSEGDIAGFESIRYEDQKSIRENIGEYFKFHKLKYINCRIDRTVKHITHFP